GIMRRKLQVWTVVVVGFDLFVVLYSLLIWLTPIILPPERVGRIPPQIAFSELLYAVIIMAALAVGLVIVLVLMAKSRAEANQSVIDFTDVLFDIGRLLGQREGREQFGANISNGPTPLGKGPGEKEQPVTKE